jgi:acyl carrier protein
MENTEAHNATITHVRQFILEHFPSSRRRSLDDTDPLLESGIIDSLGVLDLVDFIEVKFAVVVADDELVPENFQNIARIAAYIESKRQELSTIQTFDGS